MSSSLRGSLPQKPLGARGIEQYARNPTCLRLALMVAEGLAPGDVLEGAFDRPNVRRPPPTAVVLGKRFERRLLASGGAELLARYVKEGLLGASEDRVVDVEAACPGKKPADIERRVRLTERLVEARRNGDPTAPNLIIMPRLRVRMSGADHGIEPDYLVAADGERAYRPGEIKSYAHRKGKTDPADVKGARRQAAVTVVALRQLHGRLGAADPESEVGAEVDLVLRWPGTLGPTLDRERVEGEVQSVERAIERLPALAQKAGAHVRGTLDDPAVVSAIPKRLGQGCYEFCDLAPACKAEAVKSHDPALLGDAAREALAGVGCVLRAAELMRGKARPNGEAEAVVRDRLGEALVAYEAVVRADAAGRAGVAQQGGGRRV